MNQDKQGWPLEPSEQELPSRTNGAAAITPIRLGITSCALAAFLLGANVVLQLTLHQMDWPAKMDFLERHHAMTRTLVGAEVVGIPAALVLGLLGRRTTAGKIGLSLVAIFVLIALYARFLLPISYSLGPGTPVSSL